MNPLDRVSDRWPAAIIALAAVAAVVIVVTQGWRGIALLAVGAAIAVACLQVKDRAGWDR